MLPEVIKEALTPAGFIESHLVQVLKAQKQIVDCFQQEKIAKQRDSSKALAESAVNEIKSLNDT